MRSHGADASSSSSKRRRRDRHRVDMTPFSQSAKGPRPLVRAPQRSSRVGRHRRFRAVPRSPETPTLVADRQPCFNAHRQAPGQRFRPIHFYRTDAAANRALSLPASSRRVATLKMLCILRRRFPVTLSPDDSHSPANQARLPRVFPMAWRLGDPPSSARRCASVRGDDPGPARARRASLRFSTAVPGSPSLPPQYLERNS
jgi:hypothetical protein